jgi:hypothetical protein
MRIMMQFIANDHSIVHWFRNPQDPALHLAAVSVEHVGVDLEIRLGQLEVLRRKAIGCAAHDGTELEQCHTLGPAIRSCSCQALFPACCIDDKARSANQTPLCQ